ncbi:response regulator transcription factor [Algibacter amylolyticus]|uniref:Response regulator transcription factor n=1 Tax=Algibacter amylolyticus TaxID=1608400 RepID=A0A5M7BED8_9FLAO|nr:response regulator transcription factor [Algibacter amylolyticus]KAA5827739.1 response regulator transcription factor [Algibacter amylolyticus]MBB5266961.1 DNA-binding LytR/AlgR family response regulator [Algibacter amylolyticus]TSJ81984.1 response regulator transcription factor [Algibacter amylolyticus]
MKFINIYIVEDEPLIAATIETALLKQGYTVVGDAEDVITALKDIAILQPDLVLIDIQLDGEKDGVDLAIELDKQQIPYLYLTSQTDLGTIERVKATQPLGYIVKPFTENGLRTNIDLAWHNYEIQNAGFLILKSDGRTHKINQNSILYLKAFDNYCYVYTATRSYLVPHTLKYMSEQLNDAIFVQTHRSYWVNINHIDSIESNKLFLKTEPIPISASQKHLVMSKLKGS